MKLLALIPARGGSKRLPGKNIRQLGDKPLIAWSIGLALDIADITTVLVSTDDQAIADVAVAASAQVPWLRPTELASDTASSVDMALHALGWYESQYGAVDGLLLLQPTSPFRSRDSVIEAISKYRGNGHRSVISVCPASFNPAWSYHRDHGRLVPLRLDTSALESPTASETVYEVSGSIYLISPAELRERRAFVTPDTAAVIVDNPAESIDIDTHWDWMVAEAALAAGLHRQQG
ncbi:acylneuraminate cytidylyltransferase family protein [Neisseriaceae bacterium JH1-16]|nr:acylneuraminate cytidylyltransferase family protein [Neisseriaceae bacterium JH1-16]